MEKCPKSSLSVLRLFLHFFQAGIPYVEVLCKNRYVGRTFIQPNTRLRQLGVAKKFGALTDNFAGKRVVLVDDSIVRGNTISPIIKLLREAGATEVSLCLVELQLEIMDGCGLKPLLSTGAYSSGVSTNQASLLHGDQHSYQRGTNCQQA